jgi:antitoxin component YwqK of YwqJK toxin-antitoxin module
MKNSINMRRIALLSILLLLFYINGKSQYKEFKIADNGDTLNAIDKKGLKQGKWVTSTGEIRGEPGFDEEGVYKDDKKTGTWKKYTSNGDIISIENYRFGGKDGQQKYFTYLGQLVKEEQWHSYDPNSPYDTIPVYGADNDQVLKYKIVRAVQYSVPNGQWTYYDPETGATTKVEHYDRGLLMKDPVAPPEAADTTKTAAKVKPKDKPKPQEVLDYEKKYSKKKRKALERTGQTGL